MGLHEDGNKPQYGTLQGQYQNASKSQVKATLKTAILEGEFNEDRENISQGISKGNRGKRIMEMNMLHQNLSHIQQSANSTVVISQNREAQIEGIAVESPESSTHF